MQREDIRENVGWVSRKILPGDLCRADGRGCTGLPSVDLLIALGQPRWDPYRGATSAHAMSCARSLRELAPTRSWGPACREAGSPRRREGYVAEAGAVIALYALAVDRPIAQSSATGERLVADSSWRKGCGAGSDLGGNQIAFHIRIWAGVAS